LLFDSLFKHERMIAGQGVPSRRQGHGGGAVKDWLQIRHVWRPNFSACLGSGGIECGL
jgi:hypothetical protein